MEIIKCDFIYIHICQKLNRDYFLHYNFVAAIGITVIIYDFGLYIHLKVCNFIRS